jgi:NACalpha-BTF3-like transcription factor
MIVYEARKDEDGNWTIYQDEEDIAMVVQCPTCEANAKKIANALNNYESDLLAQELFGELNDN